VYWLLPFKMQVPSPPNYSKAVRLYLQWSRSMSNVCSCLAGMRVLS